MKVAAVIPAYNAEKTVGQVIEGLRDFIDAILVVDDGSLDATAQVASKAGAKVIRHSVNQGLGMALQTGFKEALKGDYQAIVTLDADGQHSPGDVRKLLVALEQNGADVIIGSRLTDRSEWHKFPLLRLLGNLILTYLTNWAVGRKVTTDSQSGCRVFLRRVLEEIKLSSTHMAVSSEIIIETTRAGFKVAEVPIEVTYENEVSYQRFLRDPLAIMSLLLRKWLKRLKGERFGFESSSWLRSQEVASKISLNEEKLGKGSGRE